MTRNLPVDPDRIASDIEALAGLTDPDHPWTRRAFTPRFLDGRAFVESRMRAAGLETRIDAAGNLFGRRPGRVPGKGAILVGSHSDTVPDGGRFDGIAGVVAGLEVARALKDQGIELDHDLEIVDCLAEEVSIFGVSCVGSRGIAGVLDPAWLARGADGKSLRDGIAEVGGDADRLADAKRSDIRAFLELHIEQGTVLESAREDVGIVTAISGITRTEITVDGRADHAGTTVMNKRADALVAAAAIVTAINAEALRRSKEPHHFAATVGEFRIEPGAANVVPSKAVMLVDARAERREDMLDFQPALAALVAAIGAEQGVTTTVRVVSDNPSTPCDETLLAVLEASSDAVGARHRRMASGAGHDTAWVARVAPAAMIFIPCRDGRSHAPEEWAETDAIALGTAVLLDAVQRIDRGDT
jgi:N-carbamoyl-L-amino-acid hydrolase